MNPIIKLLREIRIERGMTQEELSQKLGKHVNQVTVWESGLTNPRLDSLLAWADALGYEFDLMLIQEKESVK